LTKLLASVHKNVMVVGDDAQSIYAFRGAKVDNIFKFNETFPTSRTMMLEDNYRSSQQILDLANAVLSETSGFKKNLKAHSPSGRKPEVIKLVHAREHVDVTRHEGVYVAHKVKAMIAKGSLKRSIAILARASRDLDFLEVELTRLGITTQRFGGEKFAMKAHVKDVVAILRILTNFADETTWHRIFSLLPGIGKRRAKTFFAKIQHCSMTELTPDIWGKANKKILAALEPLGEMLKTVAKQEDQSPSSVLRFILKGWYLPQLPNLYDDPERLEIDFTTLTILRGGRMTSRPCWRLRQVSLRSVQ